jgi:hypothetical protein
MAATSWEALRPVPSALPPVTALPLLPRREPRGPYGPGSDRRSGRVRPYASTGAGTRSGQVRGPMHGEGTDQGRIRVYGTGHGSGGPDRALLERVLSGLRRL